MNPIQQAIEAFGKIVNADRHRGLLQLDAEELLEAEAALSALQSLQGVELPEPRAWMMEWPQHSPSFTTDKSDYVTWEFGKPHYSDSLKALYTADQLHAAVAAAMARGAVPQGGEANPSSDECPKCGSVEWDEVYQHGSVTPYCRRCAYSSCDHEWSLK